MTRELTAEGCNTYDRISEARRIHLTEVFSEWPSEKHVELEEAMKRLRRELVHDSKRPTGEQATALA